MVGFTRRHPLRAFLLLCWVVVEALAVSRSILARNALGSAIKEYRAQQYVSALEEFDWILGFYSDTRIIDKTMYFRIVGDGGITAEAGSYSRLVRCAVQPTHDSRPRRATNFWDWDQEINPTPKATIGHLQVHFMFLPHSELKRDMLALLPHIF